MGTFIFNVAGENHKVKSQLNILIPVGTAITIVAAEKKDLESTSRPTVYIWCAQTIKPKKPIDSIAPDIPKIPKIGLWACIETILLTIPKAGNIKT